MKEQENYNNLNNNDYRNAHHEFEMLCFVADYMHTYVHGDRAAQRGKYEQGFFRYSQAHIVFLRYDLVVYADYNR